MQQASLFDASSNASAVHAVQAEQTRAGVGVLFPENLKDPDFQRAWADWEAQQGQLGFPLTVATRHAQLAMLSAWGPVAAAASIRESIRNGWRKLVPPGAPGKSAAPPGKRLELPTADQIAARDAVRAVELAAEREKLKQEFQGKAESK